MKYYRDTIMSYKNNEDNSEGKDIIVLECAKKHGCTEADIASAIHNAISVRHREFNPPAHVALAGPDLSGRLIEILYAEQMDGALIVYHAMKLTAKMANELDL